MKSYPPDPGFLGNSPSDLSAGEGWSFGVFMGRKEEYRNYLKSFEWDQISEERLRIDNYECRLCGNPAQCVHHKRYPDVLGYEDIENDLTSLCNACHSIYHGKRPKRKKNRRRGRYERLRAQRVANSNYQREMISKHGGRHYDD